MSEKLPRGAGPCRKQKVTALVVVKEGNVIFEGTNWCAKPQAVCPRGDMASGVGYHMCDEICQQSAHAEINAIANAGKRAKGGTLILIGHTYACRSCVTVAAACGINKIIVLSEDGRTL